MWDILLHVVFKYINIIFGAYKESSKETKAQRKKKDSATRNCDININKPYLDTGIKMDKHK